jgi:ribosomal protein L19
MKYLINRRGRAVRVSDGDFVGLLSIGWIEIDEESFKKQQYYPQFDQGDSIKYKRQIKSDNRTVSKKEANKNVFSTVQL